MTTNGTSTAAVDQAAVAAVPQQIVAAWAGHDADAFAATFTEDGSMILPGVHRSGREQVRTFMAEAFAGPYRGTRVTGDPIDLRFLNPDTALLITRGGVLLPGETEVAAERSIRASWLLVRRDEGWRIAAYQNSPSNPA